MDKERKAMKKRFISLCLLACIAYFSHGCASSTPAQRGAVGGAAAGAVAGQVIGRDTKSTLIGAGAGALGGALLNDSFKVEKRQ
jgi:hypothetical protein